MTKSHTRLLSLLILFSSAIAGPQGGKDSPLRGRYIVQLKPTTTTTANAKVTFPTVDGITDRWPETRGFAGNFSAETVQRLRASPDVAFVEQDGVVRIAGGSEVELVRVAASDDSERNAAPAATGAPPTAQVVVTQPDAPWGLARLSQDAKLPVPGQYSYVYGAQAGAGVDVYVLDTGILVTHTEFAGRAVWGATFGGYHNADGHGHGTHLAATIAGARYGVAKKARVIAVKVLGDDGSGTISSIISGINWAVQQWQASGRPSIIVLASAGAASAALDNAVTSTISAGVPIVVPATDPNSSPARAPGPIIKVGATSIADAAVIGGSFGAGLTLFAPGANTESAGIASIVATSTISGVTPAVAHVAGLAAYLLSVLGPLTVGGLGNALVATSVQGALTGVGAGTANRLASNNVTRLGIVVL